MIRCLLTYFADAPGNDGNASMPEQVKRPIPWMMMMMMINLLKITVNRKQCFINFFQTCMFYGLLTLQ
jgi:hypothetical protein